MSEKNKDKELERLKQTFEEIEIIHVPEEAKRKTEEDKQKE